MAATRLGYQPLPETDPLQASAPLPTAGTSPVGMPIAAGAAPPGMVIYCPTPEAQGGTGGIVMPIQFAEPKKYDYKPSDYLCLSVFTLVACGIFSPLTLTLSIPALLFSLKSLQNAKLNTIKLARHQGLIAAYLNIIAIFVATVIACVATGLVVGLNIEDYVLQKCLNILKAHYGGELPTLSPGQNIYAYSCIHN